MGRHPNIIGLLLRYQLFPMEIPGPWAPTDYLA